jgi:hypothetical protein
MSWIMVDVEASGSAPGLFSMVSFGAVLCTPQLNETFYGECAPLPGSGYDPVALAVSGLTHEKTLLFPDPELTMKEFEKWVVAHGGNRPMFISDNNGFDWQFINFYFHKYCGYNPFGFSSTNLGSLYKGMQKDMFKNFKHLRKTKHSHHPVDDARGNAEAFLTMQKMGLTVNK